MSLSIEIWHTQKNTGKIITMCMKMVKVKRLLVLKLWTFSWGQGECEWPKHVAIFNGNMNVHVHWFYEKGLMG